MYPQNMCDNEQYTSAGLPIGRSALAKYILKKGLPFQMILDIWLEIKFYIKRFNQIM
jgi:hypothetical protein